MSRAFVNLTRRSLMSFQMTKRIMIGGGGIIAGALAVGLSGGPIALSQNASGPQVTTTQLHFEGTTAIAAGASGRDTNTGALEFGPSLDVNTSKPQITGTVKPARVPADHVPAPTANTIVVPNA